MKIAFTVDSFVEGRGGVSTAVGELARHLRQRGHQIRVYTSADSSHKQNSLDIIGMRALNYERFPGGRTPIAPVTLFQGLASFNPDVIHNHSMSAMGIQSLAAARLLNIPILSTCHVYLAGFLQYAPIPLEGFPFSSDVAWLYTAFYFNRFSQITTPSISMKRELIAHGLRKPVIALSNGIDIDIFTRKCYPQIKSDQIKLLHVGRLGYEKRVDILIRAFAILISDYPDINLQIVGDGPDVKVLKQLAADLGVASRVNFTGFIPRWQLPQVYQQADIFITASTVETQGLVVLEAMASNLPIVGVNAMALPDLIQQGVNGYLVNPNDVRALVDAIAPIIRSEELRHALGYQSHRLAQEHSFPNVIPIYEQLYQNMDAQRSVNSHRQRATRLSQSSQKQELAMIFRLLRSKKRPVQ
jgi:1,2-diacylglycerol 3-alpha-glucosyltransferase